MIEKINLNSCTSTLFETMTLDSDSKTVNKLNGNILPKPTGVRNDANLLRIRTRKHIQHSVADLRMVVRVQRRNKHPHSTKKHK